MSSVLTSSAVARELEIPYTLLFSLLRTGKLTPPAKDSSGDYLWLPEDVQRLRDVLQQRKEGRRMS